MHANIRGSATNDQVLDAPDIQHELEISMLKSTTAGLVDDLLTLEGIQLGDDIMAWFTSNKQPSQGSFVADTEAGRVVPAAG